jgi:hypothetical protein
MNLPRYHTFKEIIPSHSHPDTEEVRNNDPHLEEINEHQKDTDTTEEIEPATEMRAYEARQQSRILRAPLIGERPRLVREKHNQDCDLSATQLCEPKWGLAEFVEAHEYDSLTEHANTPRD